MVDVARAVDASARVEISQVEVSGPAHGSVGADVPATAWASRIWSTIVESSKPAGRGPFRLFLTLLWLPPSHVCSGRVHPPWPRQLLPISSLL
jgi:hypothetical protein